jgi:hypothetical protein
MLKQEQWQQQEDKQIHASMKFARVLLGLEGAQFLGLFYITYGLYGWDVGEPVSYLLTLSVELVALLLVLRGAPASREDMFEHSKIMHKHPELVQLNRRLAQLEERLSVLSLRH